MTYLHISHNFQGVADVFLRSPGLYAPLLQFIENVMTGPSSLTATEREIIAAHVSNLNHCGFCLGVHKSTIRALGADTGTVDTLEKGPAIAGISDSLRAIIEFSTKLTQSPETVNENDITALKDAGLTDQTIEDAINVISLFNYVNRLVDAFGIEGNQPYFDFVGTTLAKQGYAPLLDQAAKKARMG